MILLLLLLLLLLYIHFLEIFTLHRFIATLLNGNYIIKFLIFRV